MRIPRIFVDHALVVNQHYNLQDSAAHHIMHVLRMKAGQSLVLFNGQGGQFAAAINSISKRGVEIITGEHSDTDCESPLQITLVQGVSRGDRMDYTLQKAVELGVKQIVPVLCSYTNIKLDDDKKSKRLEHWRNIIINACEQSGRNRLPELSPIMNLDEWLQQDRNPLKLILHPAGAMALSEIQSPTQAITLLAGPEGGFSDDEVTLSKHCACYPLSLGPRILRTETAALAAISACQTLWGDFAGTDRFRPGDRP